jgi:hypothetical protein
MKSHVLLLIQLHSNILRSLAHWGEICFSGVSGSLILGIGILLISFSSHARHWGHDFPSFYKGIREIQESCPNLRSCGEFGISVETIYDLRFNKQVPPEKLGSEKFQRISEIADGQAQIWADTILEGEYEADGVTQLDRIEGVFFKGELLAYYITYSERGWFLGHCDYDFQDRTLLKGCDEGQIIESAFISPALTSWFADDHAYARFVRRSR